MFEGTIDGSSIVAEIEMLRTLRDNAVILVEGLRMNDSSTIL